MGVFNLDARGMGALSKRTNFRQYALLQGSPAKLGENEVRY
jgi:hypothetical protein